MQAVTPLHLVVLLALPVVAASDCGGVTTDAAATHPDASPTVDAKVYGHGAESEIA